jgi:hypothetical protein
MGPTSRATPRGSLLQPEPPSSVLPCCTARWQHHPLPLAKGRCHPLSPTGTLLLLLAPRGQRRTLLFSLPASIKGALSHRRRLSPPCASLHQALSKSSLHFTLDLTSTSGSPENHDNRRIWRHHRFDPCLTVSSELRCFSSPISTKDSLPFTTMTCKAHSPSPL